MDVSPRLRLLLALAAAFMVGVSSGLLLRSKSPVAPAPRAPPASTESGSERGRVATSVRDATFEPAPARDGGGAQPGTADFLAEMRAAMAHVDEWDRLRRLHATIDTIDPANIEAAARQVRLLPEGDRWTVAWMLGEHWGGFDAAGAMSFAQNQ
jgi:hypothetical protein